MTLFNQVGKGTYWRALHLARHLVRRGHTVTVMPISRDLRFKFRERQEQGVTIVETPDFTTGMLRSGWDVFDALARVFWLRKTQYDLVHAFETRPVVLIPSLYAQKFCGAKLVMDWCDWFGAGGSVEERPNRLLRAVLRPVETFFEERFRTYADGSTVINTVLRKRLQALGVEPETIFMLRNGSDVENLRPFRIEDARQRLELVQDVKIIGYIGAIFQQDAQLMAEAFNIIHQAAPNTRLLVIGYCNIPIDSLVKFPQAVSHTGPIPGRLLNDYLAACDIFWLPLRNSGANQGRLPLKLNDYMAVGRPIVTTAVGDAASIVNMHQLGLVSADHADDLAAKVLSLLANPAQKEYFGRQARQAAETVFGWDLITAELERFYEMVMSASKSRIEQANLP